MIYDVIIIGAGTAGMTAALNALRNGKTVLVLEKETVGGQISLSPRVENFPTITAISGAELSDRLFEQIMHHGADFELERSPDLKRTATSSPFLPTTVRTKGNRHHRNRRKRKTYRRPRRRRTYRSRRVLLRAVRRSVLQGRRSRAHRRRQYRFAIRAVFDELLQKVHVCTLFDRFFADKAHVDNLMTKDNVAIYHNLSLKEFLSDGGELSGLVFENTVDKSEFRLPVKAVFIAIGQIPDNSAFKDFVDIDKNGYIVAGEDGTTGTDGLFVAGDCRTKHIRQLATAAADGAIAATNASIYLK